MSAKDVLVTGFPRQVARSVVRALLDEEGERKIVVLCRPRNAEDAREFIASLDGRAERVRVLEADVTSIDFGLTGGEYVALARSVGVVHHTAVALEDGPDPRAGEHLNRQGVRELIAFARASKEQGAAARSVMYSSVRVAGDFQGVLREEDLELGQRFRSPVEASLFRAERTLRRARGEIPVTVVRASTMVGHSETGEVDAHSGAYVLALLCLAAPMELTFPLRVLGEAPVDLVPVDYVARAAVALGADPSGEGRTFHLVSKAPMPARRVVELLSRAAGRELGRGFVPVHVARAILSAPGLERLARNPRAFVERLVGGTSVTSQGARELLVPRGVECPPFERYVDAMVTHVAKGLASRVDAEDDAEPEVYDPLA